MSELSFDVTADGPSRVVIAVSGEVDPLTARQLADCLCAHADCDVTVDLSNVRFLDSSGLAALVHAYKVLRNAGRRLRTTGERDNVLTVMDVTNLTDVFHGKGEDEDAVRRGPSG
jgi:anti-sigma B factor antagonist